MSGLIGLVIFGVMIYLFFVKDRELEKYMYTNEDYIDAKTRLTITKAEREELKLSQERGDLLSREEVNLAWAEKVNIIKNKILALPELAPMLCQRSAGEIKKIIQSKAYEILNELANEASDFEHLEPAS